MKTIAAFTLILLVLASCTDENNSQAKPATQTSKVQAEDFDTFLDGFFSDSIFQKSRIKFPLSTEVYDVGTDSTTTPAIKVSEWTFFDIKGQKTKYILRTRKEKDQYIMNVQMEDTGVYVDYIFGQLDGKWVLVKIVDQST